MSGSFSIMSVMKELNSEKTVSDSYANITENLHPANTWEQAENHVPEDDLKLGLSFTEKGSVIFRLWSPAARTVRLALYRPSVTIVARESSVTSKSTLPDEIYSCLYSPEDGIWTYECQHASTIDGWFYSYLVDCGSGEKACLDPYAVSMEAFQNDGSAGKGAVVNLRSTESLPERTILKKVSDGKICRGTDAVVYEVSIRDASINSDGTGGTYKAFEDRLDHIKSLGITHVQLMPVLNFYFNNETDKSFEEGDQTSGCNYNWGYDPHNWFTPEGWYSETPEDPYSRVRELRSLVSRAHEKGLRVILDVVYNHISRTDLLEDIVPGYYLRRNTDGSFKGNSGCGNDTASERLMMRRLISDSTAHWVEEYGVDGFRFDLMGLIDVETMLKCFNRCRSLKQDMLFIGEGWKMYDGPEGTRGMDQNFMLETDDIAVFNDEFRDICKGGGFNERMPAFLNGGTVDVERLFLNCTGRPQLNYKADNPADSVLYIDCHDGLTLHDSLALNTGADESRPEDRAELLARLKLANALLLTSQGIPFIHAGQESGRSKKVSSENAGMQETEGVFVRNSYKSSDSINRIRWQPETDAQKEYACLWNYVAGLISLRKKHNVFRLKSMEEIKHRCSFIPVPENPQVLAYSIKDEDGIWYLLFNASAQEAEVELFSTDNIDNGEKRHNSKMGCKREKMDFGIIEVYGDDQTVSSELLYTIRLRESSVKINPLSFLLIKTNCSFS